MGKIKDFLKLNWKGATIGGLGYIISMFILIMEQYFFNPLFAFFYPFVFPMIILVIPLFWIHNEITPILQLFFIVWDLIAYIGGLIFWIILCAFIQNKLRNKTKRQKLVFLVFILFLYLILAIISGILLFPSYHGDILPSRCYFVTGFMCTDYELKTDSVRLQIKNNLNSTLDLMNINLYNPISNEEYYCVGPNIITANNWQPHKTQTFEFINCDFKGGLVEGEKAKIHIKLKFQILNGEIREVMGDVYSTVR